MPPNLPLFIMGCPRSGTTLLRLMFNSHSKIAVPDETGILNWLYNRPFYKKWLPLKAQWHQPLVESLGKPIARKFDELPKERKQTTKQIIDFLMGEYAKKEGKPYWGEKTPLHIHFVDQTFDIFPQATYIFLVRDPRAVFASTQRYIEKKRKQDFWITENIKKATSMWKEAVSTALKHQDKVELIRYEDLVQEPKKTLRQLCGLIGVRFEKEMLQYHQQRQKTDKEEGLTEWQQETTKPVNPKNIDKWKNELSEDEIAYIEEQLQNYMQQFGYPFYIRQSKSNHNESG